MAVSRESHQAIARRPERLRAWIALHDAVDMKPRRFQAKTYDVDGEAVQRPPVHASAMSSRAYRS